jgi:hypothetical protein
VLPAQPHPQRCGHWDLTLLSLVARSASAEIRGLSYRPEFWHLQKSVTGLVKTQRQLEVKGLTTGTNYWISVRARNVVRAKLPTHTNFL